MRSVILPSASRPTFEAESLFKSVSGQKRAATPSCSAEIWHCRVGVLFLIAGNLVWFKER